MVAASEWLWAVLLIDLGLMVVWGFMRVVTFEAVVLLFGALLTLFCDEVLLSA